MIFATGSREIRSNSFDLRIQSFPRNPLQESSSAGEGMSMSPQQLDQALNSTYGALLVGALCTAVFVHQNIHVSNVAISDDHDRAYGIMCQQCFLFFRRFTHEGFTLKYCVRKLSVFMHSTNDIPEIHRCGHSGKKNRYSQLVRTFAHTVV
jgi:hypothetical protein